MLFITLTFASCTSDNSNTEVSEKSNWDLSENFLKNGVELGILNDLDQLNRSMDLLVNEVSDFEEGHHIVYVIKSIENKLYMTGYQIYDNDNKLIEEKGINGFEKVGGPAPIDFISDAGGCPDGYSSLGKCGNFGSDRNECLGDLAQGYFSSNLSGIGDCAEVRLIVGGFNTRACGRTC